jgi:hypothetical protein
VFPGWSPNGVRPWVLVAWILLFSAVIFTVTIWLAFNT